MADGDNDDLKEAFDLSQEQVCDGLVKLLKLDRSKETQPLEFVDTILSRQVTKIPEDRIKDMTEFYPLLASDFRMIQSATFDVLHKALPKVQQELSVNVLLEGTSKSLVSLLIIHADIYQPHSFLWNCFPSYSIPHPYKTYPTQPSFPPRSAATSSRG